MTERYDVAVLGAGPGGAAAALTAARRGLRVALFEPSERGAGPGGAKPCGEGLMPSAREALAGLGLEAALAAGLAFERLRYRVAGRAPLTVELPAPGLTLSRWRLQSELDAGLAAEPRVERIACKGVAERSGEGRFVVVGGGVRAESAALVAADGLRSATAPWLRGEGRRRGGERWGARAHFAAGARTLDAVEVHLAQDVEVYLTPLPEGLVNVAVLADDARGRGAQEWIEAGLCAAPDARAWLGVQEGRAGSRALWSLEPRAVAGGGVFLVGDAGGGVDPIVGCGTTVALRTGILAALAAEACVRGGSVEGASREYARAYRAEVRARRSLARGLRALAPRPRLARATVSVARRMPGLTRRAAARIALGAELVEWRTLEVAGR